MGNYEIQLDQQELNLVLTGLGQLAYIQSAQLIQKISDQAKEQTNGIRSSVGDDLSNQDSRE